MLQLTELRKELKFNKEIKEIINVLKEIASSEFYRILKARKKFDEFNDYLKDFFQSVNITGFQHAFFEDSSLPKAALIVTSDAGFLGRLNVSVVKAALKQYSGKEKLIIVGQQGAKYVKEEAGEDFTVFAGISDDVSYEETEKIGSHIIKGVLNKEFGRTVVVYPRFVSFAAWEVQSYQLFPCRFVFREAGPGADKGDLSDSLKSEKEKETIIEPDLSKVIEYLVKVRTNYILYGIFWESKLSEWSARVMHLEGSFSRIKEMHNKLHRQYFHLLHEISDKNIREIFAGRLEIQKKRNWQ